MLIGMRRLPTRLHALRLMQLIVLPAWLAVSGTCVAATQIHHCVAADGTPTFTDKPCSSVDAVPAAPAANPLSPRGTHAPHHCPMDGETLRKRVARVFQAGNANALAGLMLWRGYGERAAAAKVRQFADLMQWPFLGLLDAEPAAPAAPGTVTVKLADPSRPRITFRIIHRDECLWLKPL